MFPKVYISHFYNKIPLSIDVRVTINGTLTTENIRENLPKDIVNPNSLVLSPHYPHYPVKSGTIAKYVAKLITSSGIELKQFSAHSTRSSTTSKATELGMSIKDICKGAGWKSENTFRKFYQLPIHKANNFQIILDQL